MRRRRVTGDERELWRRATKDVRPLAPRPITPLDIGETREAEIAPLRALPPLAPTRSKKRAAAKPSAFAAGDPKLDRHARRGRIDIEATLDLHGMGQAAAHVALASFLERAAREKKRCVLVITGKGATAEPFAERPRGILRARFFDWMNEAHLRALVARVSPAAQKHGGQGAFYVFLKTPGR
jgi:DNA-nicking Smr family endonuclease